MKKRLLGIVMALTMIWGSINITLAEPLVAEPSAEPALRPAAEPLAADQFPQNPDEVINWPPLPHPQHNFQRVVIAEGSAIMRINGQIRNVDTVADAVPFVEGGVLYVPITAARRALGAAVVLTVDGASVTATQGGTVRTATGIERNGVLNVPIQTLAVTTGTSPMVFNQVSVGWDEPRARIGSPNTAGNHSGNVGTLVVTTGVTVFQGTVGNPGRDDRNGAGGQQALNQALAWDGSQQSLRLAENYYIWQRQWAAGGEQRGGWPTDRNMNENLTQTRRNAVLDERVRNPAPTLDDDATIMEIRYLLRIYDATGIERFHTAAMRGLNAVFGAQVSNGGFQQGLRNPGANTTAARITFNDNAMINTVTFIDNIARNPHNFPSIPSEMMTRVVTSRDRAIDAILSLQIRSNAFEDGITRPTAWGAQHNQNSPHQPVWARDFEPPSISGSESIGVMRFLMSIPNPDDRVVEAVHAAMFFFNYVEIRGYQRNQNQSTPNGNNRVIIRTANPNSTNTLWARFICIDTFEPLLYDRQSPNPHATNPTSANWPGVSTPGGGIRRNLYGNPEVVLNPASPAFDRAQFSTDRSTGPMHLPASYANLSWERRLGYAYFGNWPNDVQGAFTTWAASNPRPGTGTPTPTPTAPAPTPTPTPAPPTPTPTPAPPTPTPAPQQRQPGDINNDGAVNIIDLTILRLYVAGNTTLDADDLVYANFDGVGAVDVDDVDALRNWLAGSA